MLQVHAGAIELFVGSACVDFMVPFRTECEGKSEPRAVETELCTLEHWTGSCQKQNRFLCKGRTMDNKILHAVCFSLCTGHGAPSKAI